MLVALTEREKFNLTVLLIRCHLKLYNYSEIYYEELPILEIYKDTIGEPYF